MQPAPVGASKPRGQPAAQLAADVGHRRAGERAGLLQAEVVDLQPADLAVPPAVDDRLGDLVGLHADRRPDVGGPGAQLYREVGHKHQLTRLAFGVAGEQLIDQAAGRLGDTGVQQRWRGDDQDGAGLGFAGGRWGQEQAEVAVAYSARLEEFAEGVGAKLVHLGSCRWTLR
jgi:hypothetical protein